MGRLWSLVLAATIFVHVAALDGPRFSREPPGRTDWASSAGATLGCAAKGDPRPTVSWEDAEGRPLESVPGLREVRGSELILEPFPPAAFRPDVHDTLVRCVARNSVGAIRSRDVRIRAVVTQPFKVQVYDEFASRGNIAVLRCHVPAFVKDFVIFEPWSRADGLPLPGEGRAIALESGELYVRSVRAQDAGSYVCRVQHRLTGEVTTGETPGRLVVTEAHGKSPPRIVHSRPQVTSEEGQNAVMACVAVGSPLPEYRWFKEEDGSLQPISNTSRVTVLPGTLTFSSVDPEMDSAKYVCVANNSLGSDSAPAQLTVLRPLEPRIHPESQTVDAGRPAALNCTGTGHGEEILWMKDGRPLPEHTGHPQLLIPAVGAEQAGMYQCLVTRPGGDQAQATAEIRLGESPATLEETFEPDVHVYPGEPFSLRCVASGSPPPRILWTKDGTSVTAGISRPGSRVESRLNVTAARPEHAGDYTCRADNGRGASSAYMGTVHLIGPPQPAPTQARLLVAGRPALLRCPVSGYPLRVVHWEKDGVRLPANHRQRIDPAGRLAVDSPEPEVDAGRYECRAEEGGLSARGTVAVQVVVAPELDPNTFPEKVVARAGARVKLLCSVVRGDGPLTVAWSRADGDPLGPDVASQPLEDSASLLLFRRLAPHMAGNYTCRAENRAAVAERRTFLEVQVPPSWTVEPRDAAVTAGQPVGLDCVADGSPNPSVLWRKKQGSHYSPVTPSYRRQMLDNGTLSIASAEPGDAGHYMCQAANGVGAGLSKVVTLTVHRPPSFPAKFSTVSVPRDQTAQLSCAASGDQPLEISWEKDKQPLSTNSRYSVARTDEGATSVLTITGAGRQDSALFTCTASNSYGSDETNIQLVVQEAPGPPTDLTLQSKTGRSVTVSWNSPYAGNSPIVRYHIFVYNTSETWNGSSHTTTVAGTDTVATVSGLKPASDYTVRVAAENAVGRGEPGTALTVHTEEEVPEGPPLDIRVHPTGAQSLKVTWKPPHQGLQHGTIQGYYVGYRAASAEGEPYQYKNVEASRGTSSYLTNLRRLTRYGVIVQAYNGVGPGPRSDEAFATTLEAAPPTSPAISVAGTTQDSITVRWTPLPEATEVKEYTVHSKGDGDEKWRQERVVGSARQHVVRGAKCGTRYALFMTAANSLGTGEPGDTVVTRTRGAAPVSPKKEIFISANGTTAILFLNAWQDGGCPIDNFTVQLRSASGGADRRLRVPPSSNKMVLPGLVPGRDYILRMTAQNAAGLTEAEYLFRSPPISSGSSTVSRDVGPPPIYRNLAVLLPVAVSLAVIAGLIIAVLLCLRRQAEGSAGSAGTIQRKSADQLGLTEFSTKGEKEYYCTQISGRQLRLPGIEGNHEYAEPYTTRCTADDCTSTLRPSRSENIMEDFIKCDSQRDVGAYFFGR